MKIYACDCCGEYHSASQMVRHGTEILYLPHAIEAYGLFKPLNEIQQHLEGVDDYGFVFPTSIFWEAIDTFWDHPMIKKLGYRKYTSKYGTFYVRKFNERNLPVK